MCIVRIERIRFDRNTKEVCERTDITDRFVDQCVTFTQLVEELQFKKEALNGEHGNVYYEVLGIDYSTLNIPLELHEYLPGSSCNTKHS
jgi:hypothetical protein